MNDICRLCCSTKFVCNDIFDEENALYIKMSLYLPIKVFKNDRLPQKICDKCSCKVNDFYQFCNETIEVQNRLRISLLSHEVTTIELVDLTLVKENVNSPPPKPVLSHCEQSTQTEDITTAEVTNNVVEKNGVKVKEEPQPPSLPVKIEKDVDISDHSRNDPPEDIHSDNSDDMCLIKLRNKKRKSKFDVRSELSTNGDIIGSKKRKRKKKSDDLQSIMSKLPDSTALSLVDDNVHVHIEHANFDSIKQEINEEKPQDLKVFLETMKKVKNELSDGETYNCCICFEQFFNRSTMSQHYREHGSEIEAEKPPAPPPLPNQHPLKCSRCQKVVSKKEWGMHWLQHWDRDRRPYRCALCEKSFRDHQQILKHGMTHKFGDNGTDPTQPDKRFVCDLCPEGFVYMKYLLSHRTRAHPDAATRPLTLRCAQCAREFAHLNSLRRHLRAHSGERNFLCNVCGKALSSREHLKFHIRIHTGYKPNVCKTCGKGFVKKCNLTLHERVHSGEKPHVCSHCGKAFSQRSTLVIHERYHSGQRPYVCGLCGRGFVAKGLLSMHLKTTCI